MVITCQKHGEKTITFKLGYTIFNYSVIEMRVNLMKLKYFMCFLFFFLASLSQFGCSKFDNKTIRVGSNVWPGYETLYLARHLGELPDNIKLIELLSATDVMEAFRLKRLEVAALTMDEAMTLVAEGIDLRVFLVMDVSNGGDQLIVRPDINELSELKGKTIGYEQTALGALMLHEVLFAGGLDIKDVTLIHLQINQQLDAFSKGYIDALITFEPVATQSKQLGGKVIFDSSHIPNTIVDVLVARKETLEKHKNLIQTLVNGQSKALDTIENFKVESLKVMAQRMEISQEQLDEAMQGIHYPDLKENQTLLRKNGKLFATVEGLNTILYEANLIAQPVEAHKLFDDSFVNQ